MVPDRDNTPLSPAAALAGPAAETPTTTVAVVRSNNRRGAVAESLALLDAEIRSILAGPSVILVHLEGGRADPSPLSSLLDVLGAWNGGEGEVVVAAGGPNAHAVFDRAGFHRECWGRPVRFLDLARDETHWRTIERPGGRSIRVAQTLAQAGCRIALTPLASRMGRRGMPATHRAMLAAIHPDDRRQFDGVPLRRAWPDLSIIEGPIGRFGREVVAIAGIDPMAVDAAATTVLGERSGRRAQVDDSPRFSIVGDPIREAAPEPWRRRLTLARGLRRDAGHGDPGERS